MFSQKTRKMWAISLAAFLVCAVMSALLPVSAETAPPEDTAVVTETENVSDIAAEYLSGERALILTQKMLRILQLHFLRRQKILIQMPKTLKTMKL